MALPESLYMFLGECPRSRGLAKTSTPASSQIFNLGIGEVNWPPL